MIFRYAKIKSADFGEVNRLLNKGWQPARETVLDDGEILVLLQKESSPTIPSACGEGVRVDQLANVRLFEGLTDAELQQVAAICEESGFDTDEIVFEEGDEEAALHTVLEGEVVITIPGMRLDELDVITIAAAETFGQASFFSGCPHSATGHCSSPCQLITLRRQRYDELIQSGSLAAYKIAENAAELLAISLQRTDAWVWELVKEQQSEEIAHKWRGYRNRLQNRYRT